jgi:hypothetical protein
MKKAVKRSSSVEGRFAAGREDSEDVLSERERKTVASVTVRDEGPAGERGAGLEL